MGVTMDNFLTPPLYADPEDIENLLDELQERATLLDFDLETDLRAPITFEAVIDELAELLANRNIDHHDLTNEEFEHLLQAGRSATEQILICETIDEGLQDALPERFRAAPPNEADNPYQVATPYQPDAVHVCKDHAEMMRLVLMLASTGDINFMVSVLPDDQYEVTVQAQHQALLDEFSQRKPGEVHALLVPIPTDKVSTAHVDAGAWLDWKHETSEGGYELEAEVKVYTNLADDSVWAKITNTLEDFPDHQPD